jgi:hypothetical protein
MSEQLHCLFCWLKRYEGRRNSRRWCEEQVTLFINLELLTWSVVETSLSRTNGCVRSAMFWLVLNSPLMRFHSTVGVRVWLY